MTHYIPLFQSNPILTRYCTQFGHKEFIVRSAYKYLLVRVFCYFFSLDCLFFVRVLFCTCRSTLRSNYLEATPSRAFMTESASKVQGTELRLIIRVTEETSSNWARYRGKRILFVWGKREWAVESFVEGKFFLKIFILVV